MAGDTTIRTVMAPAMHLRWNCEAIDVEAAFLNVDLEEDVFVEVPDGFETGTFANCSRQSTELFNCSSPTSLVEDLHQDND